MDLRKRVKEVVGGIVTTVAFFGDYARLVFRLTFRPSAFASQYSVVSGRVSGSTASSLFLFTTILILESLVQLYDRLVDATGSISDLGIGVVLQSGTLWDAGWEALVTRTLPLAAVLLGIGWIMGYLCGTDHAEKERLRTIFPYFLWRSLVLLLVFSLLVAIVFALILLPFIVLHFDLVWLPLFYPELSIGLILLLGFLLGLWRLSKYALLFSSSTAQARSRFRIWIFSLSALLSLAIPLWWSSVQLSSAAEKVAIVSENALNFEENSNNFSLTAHLRNLSGRPLFAKSTGSLIEWWDDEKPVTETGFLEEHRVPNGIFAVELAADTELKDEYQVIKYQGDVSKARLNAKSYTIFDGMGGPEVQRPSQAEYDETAGSFKNILNGTRAGRIDFVFVVVTPGGEASRRTVTILRSKGG